jgi:chromosome partitioning protein
MRVSHAMADTLITPINDSFIDFDVLGRIDPASFEVLEPSHYSELVLEARRQRQLIDQRITDWVVVRNRMTLLDTPDRRSLEAGLGQLGARVGFRIAHGISDRIVFRELFPRGLTALDAFDHALLGVEPSLSHLSARDEIRALIASLELPGIAVTTAPAPDPQKAESELVARPGAGSPSAPQLRAAG